MTRLQSPGLTAQSSRLWLEGSLPSFAATRKQRWVSCRPALQTPLQTSSVNLTTSALGCGDPSLAWPRNQADRPPLALSSRWIGTPLPPLSSGDGSSASPPLMRDISIVRLFGT